MHLRPNIRVSEPGTRVESANHGGRINGEAQLAHFNEQLEGFERGTATDEGGVVYGVFVRLGNFVEQFTCVGRESAGSIDMKNGVAEEEVGGGEEAGNGSDGVELLAGAESGGACASSEKRA